MQHLRLLAALAALLALVQTSARADEAQEPTSYTTGSVYFTTAFATTSVDGIPDGLDRAAYDLPVIAGAEFTLHGARGVDVFGDLHGGSETYGFDPLWGGNFGFGFHNKFDNNTLAFRFGFALEDQATLSQSPVGGSYLDIWRWGFFVRADYTGSWLEPFASLRWWYTPDATISSYEGIDTDIAHNATYGLTLGLRMHLPLIMAEASITGYSLGATAIGSKEFAYFIGQQNAFQPEVGVGLDLGRWEAWVRYSRTFPTRNDDATEYLYQTPAYYNDNLMVRGQLTAEVRWKF